MRAGERKVEGRRGWSGADPASIQIGSELDFAGGLLSAGEGSDEEECFGSVS